MSEAELETQEEEPTEHRPRWLDWVEKNSTKRRHCPRPRREPTRWQKPGPIRGRAWKAFYAWAERNAVPKTIKPAKVEDEDEKKKKPKRKPLEKLLKRIATLSVPRHQRKRYIKPRKDPHPYMPIQTYHLRYKRPVKREPTRPFKPQKIPLWFQHDEVEYDFWSNMRFPVVKSAKRYNASERIQRLALPKVLPEPGLHCEFPQMPIDYIQPRVRMNYVQWHEHLRRLEYFAKPLPRKCYRFDPYYDF